MNSLVEQVTTDNDALFKQLCQRPNIAWPTVTLMATAILLFFGSSAAYLSEHLSLGLTIALNSIAAYLAFTVAHDASHNALSTHRSFNDWCGRISTALLSPVPFFKMFRYIHMQHHRFTNEESKDPDLYCGRGPAWLLPLKWATLDVHYFVQYLNPELFRSRPLKERWEFAWACLWAVTLAALLIGSGFGLEYLLLFIIPTRIAVVFLAFAFDFLPHYPHQAKASEAPFQATANRVGWEWLLTPVLLSQNYHLVHHLYPTLPFYRYLKVWRAREHFHLAQDPAQVSAFGLGIKSPDATTSSTT